MTDGDLDAHEEIYLPAVQPQPCGNEPSSGYLENEPVLLLGNAGSLMKGWMKKKKKPNIGGGGGERKESKKRDGGIFLSFTIEKRLEGNCYEK